MRSHRRAFTLRDLCVLLCLAALTLIVVVRGIHSASGSSNRIKCASNLRQIGQAIALYAAASGGAYPRTVSDRTPNPVPNSYTSPLAPDPFAPGGPGPNDVSSLMFLLIRTGHITPDVFVCPSSDAFAWDYEGGTPTSRSNFPGRANLSYGHTNAYPGTGAREAGFKLKTVAPSSDFAVAADMGPGPIAATVPSDASRPEIMSANSPNHEGDGQNALYEDGHVDWSATPYCGAPRPVPNTPRDNIYAFGFNAPGKPSAGTHGPPTDQYDSVVLPTFLDGRQPSRTAVFLRRNAPLLWALGAVLLIGLPVAVAAIWAFRRLSGGATSAGRV